MSNHEALYRATNVKDVLENREAPFALSSAEVTEKGARVTVSHQTQLEPISMMGEAVRTNGETDSRLLFDAFSNAVGDETLSSAMYLGEQLNPDGTVEVRTFTPHGEVFSAVAQTPAEALDMTFRAMSVQEA